MGLFIGLTRKTMWPYLFTLALQEEFYETKLCEHLKDLYTESCLGSSVLHIAISGGNECTISFLLENGAVINHQNHRKETPLHWACKFGNDDIVRLLLLYGAKVDVKDVDGNTPLHWAVDNYSQTCINLLLLVSPTAI